MKPVEFLKKPYGRLVVPADDGTFSAEIFEFPGCIAVGQTPAEALANLEEVAVDWIGAALEQGQEVPEPMDSNFSGKLVLRMPKSLHKRASLWAERDGVSLNQFIVSCIAEHVGTRARPITVETPLYHSFANVSLQLFGGGGNVAPAMNSFTLQQQITGPSSTYASTEDGSIRLSGPGSMEKLYARG